MVITGEEAKLRIKKDGIDGIVNTIINADCLDIMRLMKDKSVDLVVTSPPYDNLRDYEGYEFNFESIAKELYRIMATGGVVVWVVGDMSDDLGETLTAFKQAIYFREIGFRVHDTMIYAKNGTGFPNPKRYHQCFEYMFIFSKDIPKTVNLIKDRKNSLAGQTHNKRWERQKNGVIKLREKDSYSIGEYGARWNIWEYEIGYMKTTIDEIAFEHPAMFPEKLVADHIQSWSNEGDLVLDPMNGSGTTTKMAKLLGRRFIGIEISEKYCKIAQDRLRQEILFYAGNKKGR